MKLVDTFILPLVICTVTITCPGPCGEFTTDIQEIYLWAGSTRGIFKSAHFRGFTRCKGYPGESASPLGPGGPDPVGKLPRGPMA